MLSVERLSQNNQRWVYFRDYVGGTGSARTHARTHTHTHTHTVTHTHTHTHTHRGGIAQPLRTLTETVLDLAVISVSRSNCSQRQNHRPKWRHKQARAVRWTLASFGRSARN